MGIGGRPRSGLPDWLAAAMFVQKIPAWMTHLSPCRKRVSVNVLEEFNDPDRVPLPLTLGKVP
jgi:hypothetical protein